jgi:hypothetical protein
VRAFVIRLHCRQSTSVWSWSNKQGQALLQAVVATFLDLCCPRRAAYRFPGCALILMHAPFLITQPHAELLSLSHSCACRHAAASSERCQLTQGPWPAQTASTGPHKPARLRCTCCFISFFEQRGRQLRRAEDAWKLRHGRQGRRQTGDWPEQQQPRWQCSSSRCWPQHGRWWGWYRWGYVCWRYVQGVRAEAAEKVRAGIGPMGSHAVRTAVQSSEIANEC